MQPFTVSVIDPALAADLEHAVGTTVFPVLNPLPTLCDLPRLGVTACYLLDLERMEAAAVERLAVWAAGRFGEDVGAVRRELEQKGTFPLRESVCGGCAIDLRLLI